MGVSWVYLEWKIRETTFYPSVKELIREAFKNWALRDLNPRHPPCKGGALPTELNALMAYHP